ncbi:MULTISPECIES: hypothetical protein [unclassified Burkholderia]|uniref:hypothetical protein n=1 Tax=unclassified Burkholderia TaxID=2613784 RepID=UPI002AAF94AD|nr:MULTISPECIES: hypothetical protein [unclassified Burkholderia]
MTTELCARAPSAPVAHASVNAVVASLLTDFLFFMSPHRLIWIVLRSDPTHSRSLRHIHFAYQIIGKPIFFIACAAQVYAFA